MKKLIASTIAVVVLLSSVSVFAVTWASLITKYSDTQITYNDGKGETILVHHDQNGFIDNSLQVALSGEDDIAVWGVYKNSSNQFVMDIVGIRNSQTIWYSDSRRNSYFTMRKYIINNETVYHGLGYDVTDWYLSNVHIYETYDEFISDALNIINNPSVNNGSELSYTIPPGNIAIIETDQHYSYLSLSTVMPLQSTSFANNPWPNTTQRIGMYNSLPSALNPSTMGNVISWQKSGNASLFGITTSAEYSENVVSNFKYIVISNPFYYPANDMDDSQYTNGNINISMDGVVNITVKNLTASVNTSTGEVENNVNGNEWIGTIDSETGGITWSDQNGENTSPTSGGNLSDPSINGFQSWLKGILQSIISIFEPAHDAIQTLSGAVGNFANWLYALYIWLPASILSVLKAAITLSIVIGVIKVFI